MQILLTGRKTINEEITDSIKRFIERGVLKENEKLPSVRELALSLSVNPNTVARAYETLAKEGYITSLEKKGCFVNKMNRTIADESLEETLRKMMASGISREEIMNALDRITQEDHGDD